MGRTYWVVALVFLPASEAFGSFLADFDGAQNKQQEEPQLAETQLAETQPEDSLFTFLGNKKDKKYLKKEKKKSKTFLKHENKGEKKNAKQDEKAMKNEKKELHSEEKHEKHKEDKKKKKEEKYEKKVDHEIEKEQKKKKKAAKKTAKAIQQSSDVAKQHKIVDEDQLELSSAIVSLQKIRKELQYLEHKPKNILHLASKAQGQAANATYKQKKEEMKAFNKATKKLKLDWNEDEAEKAADEYSMKLQQLKDEEDKDAKERLENEKHVRRDLAMHALDQAEEAAKNMLKHRLDLHDAQLAAGESRKHVEQEARENEYLAEHLRDKAEAEHDHVLDAIHRIFAKAEGLLFEIQLEGRKGVTPSPKKARKLAKNGSSDKKIEQIRERLLEATTTGAPFLSDLMTWSTASRLPSCTNFLCLLAAASLGLALVSAVHKQFSPLRQRTMNAPPLLG